MNKIIVPDKIPKRWDYNQQEIYLTRGQKTKMQIAISKMDKSQMKKQIEFLKQMENDKMKEFKKFGNSNLILPPYLEDRKKAAYKMAIYCRECAKFVDYYMQSLEHRKKL